jgi:dolichyl-phosphate beta-glucosyltransferase
MKLQAKRGAFAPMKVSLVIPAYNESGIILDTLRTVSVKLAELADDYEVVLVDDGSTDNMTELVLNSLDPHVRLERYSPNRGKGRAVRTGMLTARGDIILYTDADLAYGVDVFGIILDRFASSGADLVIGSRRLDEGGYQNYPPLRVLMSKCFSLLSRKISGLTYDTQCGIKAYRRAAARQIFSECITDGFSFDFEALMRADRLGLKVEEIPVSVVNFRESKINVIRDSLRMFRDVFRIRRAVRKDSP